jgi:hypothetical protein
MIGTVIRFLAGAAAAWLCKQVVVWFYTYYSTQRWLKTTSIPGPPSSSKLTGA